MTDFCATCGFQLNAGDKFCRQCGARSTEDLKTGPASVPPMAVSSQATSGKAIGSFVCGLVFLILPFGIAAIVLGHIALSEIRRSAGRLRGRGLAIAGLVLGYAGIAVIPFLIVAAIAIPNLVRARIAANESSAEAQFRTLVTAEMNYAESHPEEGFTCSLSTLAQGGLIPDGLAGGSKSGYRFEISGCMPGPDGSANHKFQAVAYPLTVHKSGERAFCSNESGVIKVNPRGSWQRCLENGRVMR